MPSHTLQSFPLLSEDEFRTACRAVSGLWRPCREDHASLQHLAVRYEDAAPLLIVEREIVKLRQRPVEDAEGDQAEAGWDADEDDEALIRQAKPPPSAVDFNILFSPTYRVPVLWFTLRNLPAGGPKGIDAVYHYLVPERYRAELRQFGVVGGISVGYHPLTDIPAYFIHPCNTAAALEEVANGGQLSPEDYLLAWFGLVGACVGLHVPSELLIEMQKQRT